MAPMLMPQLPSSLVPSNVFLSAMVGSKPRPHCSCLYPLSHLLVWPSPSSQSLAPSCTPGPLSQWGAWYHFDPGMLP